MDFLLVLIASAKVQIKNESSQFIKIFFILC